MEFVQITGEQLIAMIEDKEQLIDERIYVNEVHIDVTSADITINFKDDSDIEIAFNCKTNDDLYDEHIVNFKLVIDGENDTTFVWSGSAVLTKHRLIGKIVNTKIFNETEVIKLRIYNN